MVWSDTAHEFPAPRDDEPAHVRQDIQDELADHLHSALERELRQETEETAARERVLAQFGDPRRVARKLWLDAMREKLMSQRVQMVASVLMLVACAGMFWMTSKIADQGREMNEAMLVRLDAIAKQAAAPPVNPEWNPVSVQLVTETGKPVPEGFTVYMSCGMDPVSHAERVDGAGRADFGDQRPGRCAFSVQTPWGEHSGPIQKWVRAGSPLHVEIVCPAAPDRLDAPLTVNWPKSLDTPEYCLVCEIKTMPRALNGLQWGREETHQIFVDHSGHHMTADRTLYDFPTPALQVQTTGSSAASAPTCCLSAPAPSCCAPPTLTTANMYRVPAALSANDHLELPGYSRGIATVTILHVQQRDQEHWIARPAGNSLEIPLELQRGATPRWTLTLPENIDANTDKTADANGASPATAIR